MCVSAAHVESIVAHGLDHSDVVTALEILLQTDSKPSLITLLSLMLMADRQKLREQTLSSNYIYKFQATLINYYSCMAMSLIAVSYYTFTTISCIIVKLQYAQRLI